MRDRAARWAKAVAAVQYSIRHESRHAVGFPLLDFSSGGFAHGQISLMPGLCRRPQLRMGAGGAWQAHRGRAELYRVGLDVIYSTPAGGQCQAALGTTGTTTETPYPSMYHSLATQ